jgi:hypothetical protein
VDRYCHWIPGEGPEELEDLSSLEGLEKLAELNDLVGLEVKIKD